MKKIADGDAHPHDEDHALPVISECIPGTEWQLPAGIIEDQLITAVVPFSQRRHRFGYGLRTNASCCYVALQCVAKHFKREFDTHSIKSVDELYKNGIPHSPFHEGSYEVLADRGGSLH